MKSTFDTDNFGENVRRNNPTHCEDGVMAQSLWSRLLLVALLLVFLCGVSHIVLAQTSSGTISGRVVDQTGGVVVGAEVYLVNQQTGAKVTTQVRSTGDFSFLDVQPGIYT